MSRPTTVEEVFDSGLVRFYGRLQVGLSGVQATGWCYRFGMLPSDGVNLLVYQGLRMGANISIRFRSLFIPDKQSIDKSSILNHIEEEQP